MTLSNRMTLPLAAICVIGSLAPAALAAGKSNNERPVVVQTGSEFDWGDAAIGAAAGFGAAVAAAGCLTLARNR
jgi:hypothetical protein